MDVEAMYRMDEESLRAVTAEVVRLLISTKRNRAEQWETARASYLLSGVFVALPEQPCPVEQRVAVAARGVERLRSLCGRADLEASHSMFRRQIAALESELREACA